MDRPLSGITVVDLVDGPMGEITRYFADLGARVERFDPRPLTHDDTYDELVRHAGKAFPDEAHRAESMSSCDVLVAGRSFDFDALRAGRPALVTMAVSGFGSNNSYSDWQATDPVLHAMSGELSRSGIRGAPPLLPPAGLAERCAATQAAYAIMVSLYHAACTGIGDHLDFSTLEGAVQSLDPGFGIGGSATMGKPARQLSRDRPMRGFQYPIIPCADGFVRICLLAKRQWQGMFRWMGSPAAFADPAFEKTAVRYKSAELIPAITRFFADKPRDQLVGEGQAHGVPIAAVATLVEAISGEHFAARNMFRTVPNIDGSPLRLADGPIVIDGERMSSIGAEGSPSRRELFSSARTPGRAFEGLLVLDLGVIVVGAETGRLFADQGADVVKVESRDFPDGNRQSYLPYDLSVGFAAGHRNKRSLGLDLRHPNGRALFLELVAASDLILSNFKPGTLEALGLDREALRAANPDIITVESSAFGSDGPWSGRMGYGPLVRAATGLTDRWRYPDDSAGFSDSITIYPDHVAARVGAIAAIALLLRRLRNGGGGHADIAQAEVMLRHFGAEAMHEDAHVGEDLPDRPWGVFPASGEDAWCVITVRDDDDWSKLAPLIGLTDDVTLATRAGRRAAGERIDRAVTQWLEGHSPETAMTLLQAAGVPAAAMLRIADLLDFAFYRERDFFRVERHPYLAEEVVAERSHARSSALPDPAQRPAPLAGEQTIEVVRDWLGLSDERVAALVADEVLQPTSPDLFALIDRECGIRDECVERVSVR